MDPPPDIDITPDLSDSAAPGLHQQCNSKAQHSHRNTPPHKNSSRLPKTVDEASAAAVVARKMTYWIHEDTKLTFPVSPAMLQTYTIQYIVIFPPNSCCWIWQKSPQLSGYAVA